MPIYSYEALTPTGKTIKGEEECYSIDDLERILEERELTLISFTEKVRRTKQGKLASTFKRRRISDDEMIAFLQTLGSLLDTGIDLVQALKTSMKFTTKGFSSVLSDIIRTVETGSQLSFAMRTTGHFPSSIIEPIAMGEETGRLSEVMLILAERLKNSKRIKERIKKASMYPAFVIVFVGILTIVVFKFALPKITASINEVLAGRPYPPVTRRIMAFANFMSTWFPWIAIMVGSLAAGTFFASRYPKVKRYIDMLKLKIPHLREIILYSDLVKGIQTLLISVQTGLTYVRGLELAKGDLSNEIIKEAFDNIRSMVTMGSSLGDAFQSQALDPYLTTIISAGEYTGRLEEMLNNGVQHYMERLGDKIDKFFAWLEPIIILFLGGVVATVILCSLVPMWESMSYINK